jgi:hypothetical protein
VTPATANADSTGEGNLTPAIPFPLRFPFPPALSFCIAPIGGNNSVYGRRRALR